MNEATRRLRDEYPLIKLALLMRYAEGAARPAFDTPFGRALHAFAEPAQSDDVSFELLDKLEQFLEAHPQEVTDDLFGSEMTM
jgi:hypothetical protein